MTQLVTTNEALFDEEEDLGTFQLSAGGKIGMDHQGVRSVCRRLAKALNEDSNQVASLKDEFMDFSGAVASVKEQAQFVVNQCLELKGEVTAAKMEVVQLGGRIDMMEIKETKKATVSDLKVVVDKCVSDIVELRDGSVELNMKLEESDEAWRMEDERVFLNAKELLAAELQRSSDTMHEDFGKRFQDMEYQIVSLGKELRITQAALMEMKEVQATKSDTYELHGRIQDVLDELQKDRRILEKAKANLAKLDTCVVMAEENRDRTQEIWEASQEEFQDVREWASRSFCEIRSTLQTRASRAECISDVEGLWASIRTLRDVADSVAATNARIENDVKMKAELGDIQRLQDIVQEIKVDHDRRTRRLFVGTRCLVCDRQMPADAEDAESAVDCTHEYHQQELYRKVQSMVAQYGSNPSKVQDPLKFVAVHVGSPKRLQSGCVVVEGRDTEDTSPGTHKLVVATGGRRPHTRGDHSEKGDLPPRTPPRQVPPLVRVSPRPQCRVPSRGKPGVWGRPDPSDNAQQTHSSVLSALSTRPEKNANQDRRGTSIRDGIPDTAEQAPLAEVMAERGHRAEGALPGLCPSPETLVLPPLDDQHDAEP